MEIKKWLTEKLARPAVAAPLGVLLGVGLSSLGVPPALVDAILAVAQALLGQ